MDREAARGASPPRLVCLHCFSWGRSEGDAPCHVTSRSIRHRMSLLLPLALRQIAFPCFHVPPSPTSHHPLPGLPAGRGRYSIELRRWRAVAALRISLAQRCALASRAVLLIEKKVVFAAVKLHSTRPPPLLGAMTRARSYYDAGLLYAAWSAWIKSAEVSRLHTRLGELACLMDMENSLQRGCTRLGGHIEMCVERSLMGELADAWSSRHRSDRGFGVWVEWVNSKWAEKRRGPEVGQLGL